MRSLSLPAEITCCNDGPPQGRPDRSVPLSISDASGVEYDEAARSWFCKSRSRSSFCSLFFAPTQLLTMKLDGHEMELTYGTSFVQDGSGPCASLQDR